jgi:hypothetical protein
MLVAAAVRRYPYSPFRVRPHNFPPWNSAVHKSVDARSASQAATKSVRPLQRTKLSEIARTQSAVPTRFDIF